MTLLHWIVLVAMGAVTGAASAQDYPNRPIRFVTAAIGGGIDFNARILAHGLTERLKQQVVVDNRGGTSIAEQTVAKSTPDGYTLLVHNNTVWVSPLLGPVPYEHEKELAPISLLSRSPNILVVHPSLQASSVKELVDLARAAPGDINYASGPVGASNHLAAELFNALAGVKLVRIGYKGGGPALNDVLAGQVKVMFATAGSVSGHVKSGRLKGLAVTSAQPSPLVPGLPTVAASGVPGYTSEAIYGFWAPARTPPAILALLHRETVALLNTHEVKQRLFNAGVESVGTTPQAFAAAIKSETARLGAVIRKAGLRVQQ